MPPTGTALYSATEDVTGPAYKQVRVERAKALLLQSKSPLIEIALEVGFTSASHFAREFKSIVGQTPRQFRQAA